jgi:hypothetical protein
MIHYHGTPITPREQLLRMEGRHFCVSYAQDQDLKTCLRIAQSVIFDNGAFSTWKRGRPFDEEGYIAWLVPILHQPHWAVVPDVIDGDEAANDAMLLRWPYGRELGAPVWHMHESIPRLLHLADRWPKVCIGSSAEYATIGTPTWCGRMDEAFNALTARHARLPWIHGLRMLGQAGNEWPLASADSTNVAQNWKRDTGCAECKAGALDGIQPPSLWNPRPLQERLA